MPESKGRKKPVYIPEQRRTEKVDVGNPTWFVPVMIGLMVVGLLWVVTYYIAVSSAAGTEYPIPALHRWNLAVGFAFMLAGFSMTTRWR